MPFVKPRVMIGALSGELLILAIAVISAALSLYRNTAFWLLMLRILKTLSAA
jgi:hypothetical protein